MKANELRIGNYLEFNNLIRPSEIIKVNAWFLRQLVNDPKEDNPTVNNFYKPIPLTEGWLLNFGFEKTKYGFVKMTEIACLRIWEEDVTYSGTLIENIEHVHQLQNLYFALTGEELTLKEI